MQSNDRAIRSDARLDTGMKASEAIGRAAHWWDTKARHMAAKIGKDDPVMASVSGISAGHAWDNLTKDEKVRVVKVWHHFHVRRPDLLDTDPAAAFKLGGKEIVQ